MSRLAEEVSEYGTVEQSPKIEGASMTMVLAPLPKSQRPKSREPQQDEEE
jgi:translation initiation factor IF-3